MNYYAITDNSDSCHLYRHLTTRGLGRFCKEVEILSQR